jgi:hypothetical protein
MTEARALIPLTAYARTSTDDEQNPGESLRWQLSRANALIVGRAEIVSVVHDTDVSRSVPWSRRPEAAPLISQLPDPNRGWTGIVVGEPQRAFGSAGQVQNILPQLAHWGVQLWVPEVGGPVDPDSEAHDLLMSMFGGLSRAERNRLRASSDFYEGDGTGRSIPRWTTALRLQVGAHRRPAPQSGEGPPGRSAHQSVREPGDLKDRGADLCLAGGGSRLPNHCHTTDPARVPVSIRRRPGAQSSPPRSCLVRRCRADHRHEPEVQGAGQLRALPQGGTSLRRQRPCRRQCHPDGARSGFRGH